MDIMTKEDMFRTALRYAFNHTLVTEDESKHAKDMLENEDSGPYHGQKLHSIVPTDFKGRLEIAKQIVKVFEEL